MNDLKDFATIFAAIIGGIFGYIFNQLSHRTAKMKQISDTTLKLSDHRVEWINNLRNTMSEFQSYAVTPGLDHISERKFYETGTKLELLMNPNDENYQELQKIMYQMLRAKSHMEKFQANPHFIEICQKILKQEWERVKSDIANNQF